MKKKNSVAQKDNKNAPNDDLASMSIEDIMAEIGCNKETATAIYETEHGINLSEPITVEEAIAELESLKEGTE